MSVITKNALVLRDLDLLRDMAADHLVHVNVSVTTAPPGSADVSHVPGVADCARQTVYCLIPDDGGLADPAGVNAMATAARAVTTTANRRRRDGPPSRVNRSSFRSSFISCLPQIDAISHIESADPIRTPSVGRNLQVRIYNDENFT
jgi:hypothetical protein